MNRYGAALLKILDDEKTDECNNRTRPTTVLPEGSRWIPYRPTGATQNGSKRGKPARDMKGENGR